MPIIWRRPRSVKVENLSPVLREEMKNIKSDEVLYKKLTDQLVKDGEFNKVKARMNLPALKESDKVYWTFECTTICPNTVRGNPCPYCYRKEQLDSGFRAVFACAETVYTRNDLSNIPKKDINKLNRINGLRLFSSGDYIDTKLCNTQIDDLILDAKDLVKLKAITKRDDFVEKYHDKMSVINVSVDSIGSGMHWKRAKELKDKYNNVRIRVTALNKDDLEDWLKRDWVNIITPNHLRKTITNVLPIDDEEIRKYVEEHNIPLVIDETINEDIKKRISEGEDIKKIIDIYNIEPKKSSIIREMLKDYKAKTCCWDDECGSCITKCWGEGDKKECKEILVLNESDEMSDKKEMEWLGLKG